MGTFASPDMSPPLNSNKAVICQCYRMGILHMQVVDKAQASAHLSLD
jgi:hypothetical protein